MARIQKKKEEEKPKIPKYYYYLLGGVLISLLAYIFWPRPKYNFALTHTNFKSIRPQMTKADVKKLVECPPGDYRKTNNGAAPRFDPPAGNAEHEIWETDFGGYCVIYDSNGRVIKVDRKPPL